MATKASSFPPPGTSHESLARLLPLESLRYEHMRQHCLCNLVGTIADDLCAPDVIKNAVRVLDYLENDLPRHVSDEQEDLVPLLLKHSAADVAIGRACRALLREHESDERLIAEIKAGLELLCGARPLPRPLDFIVKLLMFEDKLRRHVAWENTRLLPLARSHLEAEDLSSLGRAMARRHRHAETATRSSA